MENELTLCVLSVFKNERHILYEFVNHYLLEKVDTIFLIDDGSNDDYFELNKTWLNELIDSGKVVIVKSSSNNQVRNYNSQINKIVEYDWVLVCDLDEFFFSVAENSTLKSLLNDELSEFDYIRVPWKLFKHIDNIQPKSIIENNVYTHTTSLDISSGSRGYKYMVKTEKIKKLNIHECIFNDKTHKIKIFKNCHNNLIQNNHYRTQSDEFLDNVKRNRGGGVNESKYKNYNAHKNFPYEKRCTLLRDKRKELISDILRREQIHPKPYNHS
jgi:hypothetical protein